MHPSLAPGAPGQMSVKELLEMRQTLGLMGTAGTSRQFAVIGPWEGEASAKSAAAAALFLRLGRFHIVVTSSSCEDPVLQVHHTESFAAIA